MRPSLPARAFRALTLRLVRFYHPRLGVAGTAQPPAPWIVVANHPNGLIDPLVLQLALGRPLAFLAKSTLFGNRAGRFAMGAFQAIPIARRKPGESAADAQQNDATFAACRAHLATGADLALFPEGMSHVRPDLAPLRTGAARIALSAAAEGTRAHLVPVGLLYGHRQTFRSPVSAVVGAPIDVHAFYTTHGEGPEAVRALTEAIRTALEQVVLEAESVAIWAGLRVVAALTGEGDDPAAIHQRALVLAQGFRRLKQADPGRAEALVEQAATYLAAAEEHGLLAPEDDRAALSLEGEPPGPMAKSPVKTRTSGGYLARALSLLCLLPFALVGTVANWATYRGIGRLARRLAGEDTDVVSTIKLLGGMALFPLTWLLWSVAGALVLGPAGLLAGLIAAGTAPIALHVSERLARRRRLLRAGWLRLARAPVAFALAQQRKALAEAVQAALGAAAQKQDV